MIMMTKDDDHNQVYTDDLVTRIRWVTRWMTKWMTKDDDHNEDDEYDRVGEEGEEHDPDHGQAPNFERRQT